MSFHRKAVIAFVLAGTALTAPAYADLTVHTAPFIASPTTTVGFESLIEGVTSYSENGVQIDYVGTSGEVWPTSQPTPDGVQSWYPNGGGTGFTSIKFAAATGFELLVSSGWFDPGHVLNYNVLLGGVSIGSGVAGDAPIFGSGWVTYGFSGATFDEVQLQVTTPGFDPAAFEAGAYDAIKIGDAGGAVPEPATWGLMILGFAALGGAMRRTTATRIRFA